MAMNPDLTHGSRRTAASDLLLFAAWTGIVCGLVEGAGLLALQQLGWLNWNMAQVAVSAEIIWISPFFDLLLFLAVAVLCVPVVRFVPRLLPVAIGLLAFFLFFDWLALSGRIRHSGAVALGLGLAVVFVRWWIKHQETARRMGRRTLPWVAALALFSAVGIEGGKWLAERLALASLPAVPADAPNVLVVIVDTLRADHLSAYGYGRATSPHIDAVARQGTLFEAAIATSSWTLPSHVSLVTGRFPHENHAQGTAIDPAFPTVAEAFRQRGYRTAAFSGNTFFFSTRVGFGRGFLHFEDFFHSWEDRAARTLYGRKLSQFVLQRLGYEDIPGRKRAADVTSAALNWIGDDRRPFLAYLNYFDVHDPYLPPQPWRDKFSAHANPGGILNSFLLRFYPEMTAAQLQDEIAAYDGAVAYADDQIGRLLDQLDRRGLAANTLVVITSDHGEMLGEHELYLHRNCLYRQAIHVPLIVRWPGHLPAGKRVTLPVSIASIPATLVDLAGMAQDAPFPGPSLAGLWQSAEPAPAWPDALSELTQFPFEPLKRDPAYYGAIQSLVTPGWHYIEHEKFGRQLFRWREDPEESTDLAATAEGKPLADQLARESQRRMAQPSPHHAATPGKTPPSGSQPAGQH